MKLKLKKNTVMQLSNDVEVVPQEQTANIAGGAVTWRCISEIQPLKGQGYLCQTDTCYDCPTILSCDTCADTCGNTCDYTCGDSCGGTCDASCNDTCNISCGGTCNRLCIDESKNICP